MNKRSVIFVEEDKERTFTDGGVHGQTKSKSEELSY